MKMWKYDFDASDVREVDCPNGTWPAKDGEGHRIFENTHFKTEDEAWDHLEAERNAAISLDTSARRNARAVLDRLTTSLADHAEGLVTVRENRARRARERATTVKTR